MIALFTFIIVRRKANKKDLIKLGLFKFLMPKRTLKSVHRSISKYEIATM